MVSETAEDVAAIQRLLNEWDPIGVYDPEDDFPDDEYDCLYYPLLARLRRGETAREIADYLRGDLEGHFGLDRNAGDPGSFAERLVRWWETAR